MLTAKNLVKAEKEVGHSMKASFAKPAPLPDLRLPNFGDKDTEISRTQASL